MSKIDAFFGLLALASGFVAIVALLCGAIPVSIAAGIISAICIYGA